MMTALPRERSAGAATRSRRGDSALIHDLAASGALTACQAVRLLEAWPHLEDDWATSPYFRTIREHTRAYIDRLRRRSTAADEWTALAPLAEAVE
jgi:hypothetical protein